MSRLSDPSQLLRVCLLITLLVVPALVAFQAWQPPVQAGTTAPQAQPPDPIFYPEFRDIKAPTLHRNGDAITVAGNEWALRLTDTDGTNYLSGSAWHGITQPVNTRFQSTFQFRMSNPVGQRADGFAFVIHNDPRGLTTLGDAGCAVGYGQIAKSVVIEFDTFANNSISGYCAENQDPNVDHVAIQLNGDPKHVAPNSLGVKPLSQNFVLGRVYTASILYEADVLTVTLDNAFVLSATVNIAQVVGDNTAWVGFVAGTATYRQNHDILNWYFTADWDLRCATFDFTRESYKFNGDPAAWIGKPIIGQPYEGWGGDGHLTIDRGVNLYSANPLFDESSGVETEVLEFITRAENPLPIRQIQIHYTHSVPAATLTGSFDLDVAAGVPQELITHSSGTGPDDVYLEGKQSISIRRVNVPESDLVRAIHPAGLRATLVSSDATDQVRIKKVGLCVKAGPPPAPPPLPMGSRLACQNLLLNLKTRRQPYGPAEVTPGDSAQPEFQFPSDVVLETYPEYLSIRYGDGYFAPMTYTDAPSAPALVPCAFERNNQLYLIPDSGTPGEPIVRFTAVGGDATLRGYLILLNYAGYYALARQNWCYAGDNAFALHTRDENNSSRTHSSDPTLYGAGYNVPPPAFACDTGTGTGEGFGPCGSFVGSLFRALGYFNVNAFSRPNDVYLLRGLYYGVDAYRTILPNSSHAVNGQQPFTHVDYGNQTQYITVPISSFSGIRVYARNEDGQRPLADARYGDPINIPWAVCYQDAKNPLYDADKCKALERVSGHWNQAIDQLNDIVLSPLWTTRPSSPPAPLDVWHSIKPGDISFTVIDFDNATVEYPHVQVVVGWGPPAEKYALADARRGRNLYSTYSAIPDDKKPVYVPYVADRFRVPGDGAVPRPFNLDMLHTATEFWVANP